ncbi:UNVERIFIED_CONTAM: hypothetical protein FKN15_011583 [Acipenser sinensis]
MAELFHGKVLIKNNKDRDDVDTDRELCLQLDNKVLLLFFGSGECPRCQDFTPTLKEFFVQLTDEFYVDRAMQLALVYISQDESEDKESKCPSRISTRGKNRQEMGWAAMPAEISVRKRAGQPCQQKYPSGNGLVNHASRNICQETGWAAMPAEGAVFNHRGLNSGGYNYTHTPQ